MYVKWVKSAQLGEDATPDILNYYSMDTAPLNLVFCASTVHICCYSLVSLDETRVPVCGGWGVQADPAQRHGAILLEQ